MKFEPIVHKASLIETPHHEYGVPVMRLTFIPESMVGCHYTPMARMEIDI